MFSDSQMPHPLTVQLCDQLGHHSDEANVKVVLNHDRGLKVCKCTNRSFSCPLLRCEGPKSLGTFEKQVPGLNFSGLSLATAFYKYPTDHRQGFFLCCPWFTFRALFVSSQLVCLLSVIVKKLPLK